MDHITLTGSLSWIFILFVGITMSATLVIGTFYIFQWVIIEILIRGIGVMFGFWKYLLQFIMYNKAFMKWRKLPEKAQVDWVNKCMREDE